jgi:hypothetical protein
VTDGQPIDMQRAVVCPHWGHVHPNRRVQSYSDFLDACKGFGGSSGIASAASVSEMRHALKQRRT